MKNANLKILIIAIFIAILGILSIYSNTYEKQGQLWKEIYRRQISWVLLGLIIFYLVSNFNYRRLWDTANFLYAFVLFLLILVFLLGTVRSGAQRWLKIIWFNFQPSEIAKLITVISLARYYSAKSRDDLSPMAAKFGVFKAIILPFLFVAIPLGLILEQPDLGSAAMIFFIFITLLYISNTRLRYLVIFLLVILLLLPMLWHFLRDYQKERLAVFLNPNIDPLGAGYTVIQSKIAIGSGGLFGKGWLSGTQSQLRFLPESHTDFIFATFVEEWGLLGAVTLVWLYSLLVRQGIQIAESTQDHFGRLIACGISSMLGVQIFVNMAMNLGMAPVVGLPLPLMSYGGSSLVATFISLGILANINKTRSVF